MARRGQAPVGAVAASRLVDALGFGADQVAPVRTLRCFGCPREPFCVALALDRLGLAEPYARGLDHGSYVDFEWVTVEPRRGDSAGRPQRAAGDLPGSRRLC